MPCEHSLDSQKHPGDKHPPTPYQPSWRLHIDMKQLTPNKLLRQSHLISSSSRTASSRLFNSAIPVFFKSCISFLRSAMKAESWIGFFLPLTGLAASVTRERTRSMILMSFFGCISQIPATVLNTKKKKKVTYLSKRDIRLYQRPPRGVVTTTDANIFYHESVSHFIYSATLMSITYH